MSVSPRAGPHFPRPVLTLEPGAHGWHWWVPLPFSFWLGSVKGRTLQETLESVKRERGQGQHSAFFLFLPQCVPLLRPQFLASCPSTRVPELGLHLSLEPPELKVLMAPHH